MDAQRNGHAQPAGCACRTCDPRGGQSASGARRGISAVKVHARGADLRIVQVVGNLFVCSRANGNCCCGWGENGRWVFDNEHWAAEWDSATPAGRSYAPRVDARRSVPRAALLNVLSLVLAAWLAVYATHTVHLLPGAGHGAEMAEMAPVAAIEPLATAAGVVAHCTVEAIRDLTRGPLVGAAVVLLAAAGLGRRPVGLPVPAPAGIARAGPRDPLALLQVFRN